MFISKLNSLLDPFDPYWDCRMMAYKTTHVCIVVLIALFILKPLNPVLFVLLTPFAVIATEMPQVTNYKDKDIICVGFYVMMSLAVFVFCFVSYLRVITILFAFTLNFLVFYLIYKRQSQHATGLSMVPGMLALMLDMGHIHLDNGGLSAALNQTLIVSISGMVAFWGHKIFPNCYDYKWKSATKRLLEDWIKLLGATETRGVINPQLLEHLRHLKLIDYYMVRFKMKFSIFRFNRTLWQLYYVFNAETLVQLDSVEHQLLTAKLTYLLHAVNYNVCNTYTESYPEQSSSSQFLHCASMIDKLTYYWNSSNLY